MSTTNTDTGEFTLHFLDYWRVIRIRLPLIILVFFLVTITAGVVTYLMPKMYQSSVTMQVRQNNTSLELFGQMAGTGFDPRFVTTQFEIIQRKEVLYPVIDKLGLEQKWKEEFNLPSKDVVYMYLRGMMKLREVRNTDLIEISVLDRDKNQAMEIANAIAEEYQKRRIEEENNWLNRSLVQLESEVSNQRKKVEELRNEMTRIRVENGIQDINPDSVEDGMQTESQVLLQVEQLVSAERLKVSGLKAKYDLIKGMTDDQIMRSVMTLEIADPTINTFLPMYQEAMAEEARMLNSGLGPKHPTVKSMIAKRKDLEKQLTEQVRVLRTTLATSLNISEQSLKGMEAELESSRSGQQKAKTSSAIYYEAKNNYIQAKKLLEVAEIRLSSESMQRTMPQSPATIWERAEPADFPSKPSWKLNIALGVIVGLGLGIGLAFFIEYLDTSVKTMEDVERYLQVPVLAVVPKGVGILMNQKGDVPDAEAYRIMRTNIEFKRESPDANTITVVSGSAGEGKSTTLANLAFTFAVGGSSTLVVDADTRRPTQHRIFDVDNNMGLCDFLAGKAGLDELVRTTKVENLHLMTSGRSAGKGVGIFNPERMIELIRETKARYDVVLFDSPPVLGVSDASQLASAADLTIIVVQHRRFPRSMLLRVKQAVINAGGTIIGVALNNVDVRRDEYYEYYTSYNSYHQKDDSAVSRAAAPRSKPDRKDAGEPMAPSYKTDKDFGSY